MDKKQKHIEKKIHKELEYQIQKWFDKNNISYDLKKIKGLDWLFLYLDFVNRFILPIKYTVYESNEIIAKLNDSSYHADVITSYKYIRNHLENGIDINSHLSSGIYKLNTFDGLKNDWNIKHVHLNILEANTREEMKNNRSDKILMLGIFNDNAYMLDIVDHPHAEGFANRDLLKIAVKNHWEDAFSISETGGVLLTNFTDKNVYDLRKKGISAGAYMENGKTYMLGNSITMAGTSTDDTIAINSFLRGLDSLIQHMHCCRNIDVVLMEDSIIDFSLTSDLGEKRCKWPNSKFAKPIILR